MLIKIFIKITLDTRSPHARLPYYTKLMISIFRVL